MTVKVGGTFVYGEFEPVTGTEALVRLFFTPKSMPDVPVPESEPQFAIEIVREHSATEFVGKLYERGPWGKWEPADPGILSKPEWQERLSKKHDLKFNMKGSGLWKVLYFRTESDQSGPYIAVALRYAEEAPAEERGAR